MLNPGSNQVVHPYSNVYAGGNTDEYMIIDNVLIIIMKFVSYM